MTVQDLITGLQKVLQVAGDIPVVVRHLETDATTELRSLGVHIDPTAGGTAGQVVLEHTAPIPANTPAVGAVEAAQPPVTAGD